MVTVFYEELYMAHEYTSAGISLDGQAFLDREGGRFIFAGNDMGKEEDLPEDLETSDRYVPVPDRIELNLGKALVFEFVRERMPDEEARVSDFFSRSGAYRRFKDLLDRLDLLDAWFEYEEQAKRDALTQWCKELGIEVSDAPPPVPELGNR